MLRSSRPSLQYPEPGSGYMAQIAELQIIGVDDAAFHVLSIPRTTLQTPAAYLTTLSDT